MIATTLRVVAPAAKRNEIAQILRSLQGPIAVQPGCIKCHVYQDILDENILAMVQVWRSEVDLSRHMGSGDYRKVLVVIDMSEEPPEVRFDTISETRGLEAIEAICEKACGKA